MILSRQTLQNIPAKTSLPADTIFNLPEKVLQFGTGVLLRGLPDYFIDKANRRGIFNGRVVIVKSTSQGDTSAFDKQDNLYTLCVRGLENGQTIEQNIINASISRVLTATEQWEQVLECARNRDMQIIISNTTEVGIQLIDEDIHQSPPKSFPGKLLAFLYERFKAFHGSAASGMVIIPTELLPDNGKKLKAILLQLAQYNSLENELLSWLENSNYFCSSLVDRIVPGKPDAEALSTLETELGYTDNLITMAEVYRLWAIEGNEQVKTILSFAQADESVVIEPNIDIYRELKLRLLNGTHTLGCGLAFLAGLETVKEAMDNESMAAYIRKVMLNELAPAIPYPVPLEQAKAYGKTVLDRFRNPRLKHQWLSITMQYSTKMKMRNIPTLLKWYETHHTAPELISLGFAAYLAFTKPVKEEDGKFYGLFNGHEYRIQDDKAADFMKRWNTLAVAELVKDVLSDITLWDNDLSALNGFQQSVTYYLNLILKEGAKKVLAFYQTKNTTTSYES